MLSWNSVAVTIAIASLLVSCSSGGPLVEQQLDGVTGVTVTRSTAPMVLYRDNSAYAAHARDYVYLGPMRLTSTGPR